MVTSAPRLAWCAASAREVHVCERVAVDDEEVVVRQQRSALRGPPAEPSTGDSNEYRTRTPRSLPSPTCAVIVSGR